MPNSRVIQSLPQIAESNGQYAYLATLDGSAVWQFLVMPAQINWDRSANYGASDTLNSVPAQQWTRTDGWTMSISGLPLSTYYERRNLTPYVEAIANFQVGKNSSPPVLLFKFGVRVFSPCVMTRFSRVERLWFPSGELAEASISFTLIEVPLSQVVDV